MSTENTQQAGVEIDDLPRQQEVLTEEEAAQVEGGVLIGLLLPGAQKVNAGLLVPAVQPAGDGSVNQLADGSVRNRAGDGSV